MSRDDTDRERANHDACLYQAELARLRAALSAMTTERNAILKATNEHTGSCFAERDQLKTTITDLVEAKEVRP